MAAPTLLLMARPPRRGAVKSRLAAELGEDAALALHRAFLGDTAALLARFAGACGGRLAVAWSEAPALGTDLAPAFEAFTHLIQAGESLGDRLLAAQRAAHAAHPGAILAVGADSPTLPEGHLTQALAALLTHDSVLAPAFDGGYVLLGVRRPEPALVRGIPWGTPAVAKATRAAARAAGVSLAEVEPWYDVDDRDGLSRLRRDLAAGAVALGTARALGALAASLEDSR